MHTAEHYRYEHEGGHRAMNFSFELPPESPVEQNRYTRQVSYCLWAIARRTRVISGRLRVQSTALLFTRAALGERWRRLESCLSRDRLPRSR